MFASLRNVGSLQEMSMQKNSGESFNMYKRRRIRTSNISAFLDPSDLQNECMGDDGFSLLQIKTHKPHGMTSRDFRIYQLNPESCWMLVKTQTIHLLLPKVKEYLFWIWYMKQRVAVEGERDERQHLLELISSNIFTTDCRLILGCLFIYPLILPTLCYPKSLSLIY